jgi:phage shock protein A
VDGRTENQANEREKEQVMGILGRMNDIIRSNLNEMVAKAENPEKMLKQAILDMEQHLRKARKQVLDTVAAEKTLEKKRLAVIDTARRWERRAELALRSGDEDLARQALHRKAEHDASAQALEGQIKVQREYVGALKQSLASLEERLRDARARKDSLVARAKAARARQKTAQAVDGGRAGASPKESRAFDTFDRMEDKVMELEAQVEAYVEMADAPDVAAEEAGLDARFAAMEKEQDMEEQLQRLKSQIDSDAKSD